MSSSSGTTTYERVLGVLADGEWHSERELGEVSYFPREWIRELELSGHGVDRAERSRFRLQRPETLTPAGGRIIGRL